MTNKLRNIWMPLQFFILSLDILSTKLFLARGVEEGNPIPAWLIKNYGENFFLFCFAPIVGGGLIFAVWLLWRFAERANKPWAEVAFFSLAGFVLLLQADVVYRNFMII